MEHPLKLVKPPIEPAPPAVAHFGARVWVWGALIAGAALWTGGGVARDYPGEMAAFARRAQAVLPLVLEQGAQTAEVRSLLVALRRHLGQHPLDARARALYAGLLLELARKPEETAAARFHAWRAAAAGPVTVPVVRAAAVVLARAGEVEAALELDRAMFHYEPRAAAELLARLELYAAEGASGDLAARIVPDLPEAWLAWGRECLERGRVAQADRWFEGAWRRWPEHLETLQAWALRLAGRADWPGLGQVLPPERALPLNAEAAALWALRAGARAGQGDAAGARADALRAVELAGERAWILLRAGDALVAAGDLDGAKHAFNRAQFLLPRTEATRGTRIALLVRLARLEDRKGLPVNAMRAWRAVLDEAPDHPEARRRLGELRHLYR